jgi:hypothetical protein
MTWTPSHVHVRINGLYAKMHLDTDDTSDSNGQGIHTVAFSTLEV